MPGRDPLPFRRLVAIAAAGVASFVLLAPDAGARREEPRIVYDSEFQGYVPVVGGVMRPDLVAARGHGRAPASIRDALREARRGLAREGRRRRPDDGEKRRVSRRWMRRHAVVSELLVADGLGRAVQGARVYRYSDPAFHAVNEDTDGARLFGTYRYMPHPFPAVVALGAVQLHDEWWRDGSFADVAARGPDIDERVNPWTVDGLPRPRLPIEYVGRTDSTGALTAITGVFNLRDDGRFPRATCPSALRIGFVVVADGYQAAFSEARHAGGGQVEARTIRLFNDALTPVFESIQHKATVRMADAIDLGDRRSFAEIESDLERLLGQLEGVLARVGEGARETARAEIAARLAAQLYRRAAPRHRLPLADYAARATPNDAARTTRVARELAARRGVFQAHPPGSAPPSAPLSRLADESEDADADLARAEALLVGVVTRTPGFVPAYPLLDRLLDVRGASWHERDEHVKRLLRLHPFDRWGRARIAASLLSARSPVEAFDHLRYTWAMAPGLGGDETLARALADHYWRLGLTEKAAVFSRLLTGGDPEDPAARVRRASR